MTGPHKEFKGLRLHDEQIEGCLLAYGVEKLVVTKETDKIVRYTGNHQGREVFFRIFATAKGSTIGFATGKDRAVFEEFANEVADKCGYGGNQSLLLSVPKVPSDTLAKVEQFLTAQGVNQQCGPEEDQLRILTRWQGPRQDKVALTYYKTTGTLLVQGLNAHVASLVMDMLRVLLPSAAALALDIQAFSVPMTVEEVKAQAAAYLPASHDWVSEPVRRHLSSALAMTQTPQKLEDYCGVAYPAVRGLEGYLKQVYCTRGSIPDERIHIGEWFEQKGGQWVMRAVPAMHVGAILAPIMAEGYSIYHAERHTLSHMGFDPENTRLVESIDEARTIVKRVLDFIDLSCAKIRA